jgi:hypothetical protein
MTLLFFEFTANANAEVVADYPSIAKVVAGTVFDYGTKTGTFRIPPENDVRINVAFGASNTEYSGTLTVADFYPPYISNTTTNSNFVPVVSITLQPFPLTSNMNSYDFLETIRFNDSQGNTKTVVFTIDKDW